MFLQGQLLLLPCEGNGSHQHHQCTSNQRFQMSPLLFMTSRINTINSLSVITLASIIHKCTDKCVFAQTTTTHRVECENIETQKLTLNHDYTNSCYCLKSVILFIELVFCLYNLVTFLYFLRLQLYNHFLSKYMLLYMHVINANGTTIIKYETGL